MVGFAAAYKEGALPGDTLRFSNVSQNVPSKCFLP